MTKRSSCLLAAGVATVMTVGAPSAHAQPEPFIGQVSLMGFTFCPRGWVPAEGQLLSIAQNTALFSLYGTTYGGNGQTTFGLPDLRGRAPISQGSGPGLPNYPQGSMGGSVSFTITVGNLPVHVI